MFLRMTCFVLLLLCATGALAQEDPDAPPLPEAPEVFATPPADQEDIELDTAPLLDSDPYDLPDSYPSLSDLFVEGGGGVLRTTRSLFDDPRALSIITPQDLAERAPRDMGEAFQGTVGVMIQRTGRGQSSPFIRGLTGQQVLILVDGVRLSNATFRAGPNQYLNTIDPGSVERIEVLRGAGSMLYGSDAIGGVINIVTKSAEDRGYNFATAGTTQRYSSADTGYYGRVEAEGWAGSTGVFAGASLGNFNDLDIGGDGGRQPATSFRNHSGDVKFSRILDPDTFMTISLQHFEAEDVFRTDRFPQNRETIFDPQQRDLAYVRLDGNAWNALLDEYSFTASFNRSKEGRLDRNPIGSTTQDQAEFIDEQTGINLVCTKDMSELGRVTYGFDWYHEEIDSTRRRVDFSAAPPTVTPRTPTQFPDDAWYSRYGAFLEWDVQVTERLNAIAGVRYEHIATAGTVTVTDNSGNPVTGRIDPEYQDWISSVGLTYELNEYWHLVSSVQEGFRAPNLDDLVATNDNVFMGVQIPNPETLPERSLTYEVGTKLNTPRWRAEAYVYWNDLQNNILRRQTNDPGFVLQRGNYDSQVHGVEFNSEYLIHNGWSVWGNYWYTTGWDKVNEEPLSRIPPQQGYVGLRYRQARNDRWFDVYGWIVDHQDKLSARDISDPRIPPGGTPAFATLNFRYGQRIGRRQRVSLNFENVTDVRYRVHGSGSEGPGIGVIATWEWLR